MQSIVAQSIGVYSAVLAAPSVPKRRTSLSYGACHPRPILGGMCRELGLIVGCHPILGFPLAREHQPRKMNWPLRGGVSPAPSIPPRKGKGGPGASGCAGTGRCSGIPWTRKMNAPSLGDGAPAESRE